jgi:hypothetical protein
MAAMKMAANGPVLCCTRLALRRDVNEHPFADRVARAAQASGHAAVVET